MEPMMIKPEYINVGKDGSVAPALDAQVRTMHVDDADVLVITCNDRLTMENMRRIRDHAQSLLDTLGKSAKVLILDGGMDIALLKTSQLPPVVADKAN